jgi:hypothetical protein
MSALNTHTLEDPQSATEYAVYNLFGDLKSLLEAAKDPSTKLHIQENCTDLLDARETLDAIIKEAQNG